MLCYSLSRPGGRDPVPDDHGPCPADDLPGTHTNANTNTNDDTNTNVTTTAAAATTTTNNNNDKS